MSQKKRFDFYFPNKFFGLGIGWDSYEYPLHLSICLPFVSIIIGIGTYEDYKEDHEASP